MSKVHFVLDEMALIGHLDCIDDALGLGRGYGIRLQIYLQSLGQLRKCFPQGQEQTVLSNTTQVFFAVNDPATADYVSARLGDATIIVESGGTSGSHTKQYSSGLQPPSRSETTGWSSSWQQQARRLLKPEEVSALSPRAAITFAPGVPPILTELIRYYEQQPDGGPTPQQERRRACRALLVSVITFVAATVMAVGATLALLHPH